MKIIFVCALVVGFTCWVTEGLTDWSWPIGATGTVIIVLTGLAWYGRKQKNPLSIEEYESEYLDRKVKQHKDGNVIG